jgi:hypothetical protein
VTRPASTFGALFVQENTPVESDSQVDPIENTQRAIAALSIPDLARKAIPCVGEQIVVGRADAKGLVSWMPVEVLETRVLPGLAGVSMDFRSTKADSEAAAKSAAKAGFEPAYEEVIRALLGHSPKPSPAEKAAAARLPSPTRMADLTKPAHKGSEEPRTVLEVVQDLCRTNAQKATGEPIARQVRALTKGGF